MDAVFLPGGLMNRNYRVRVGDDDVVLRFYDRDPGACAKEAKLLDALHGHVAVPELLYAQPAWEPVPFTLLEHVTGTSMREVRQKGTAKAIGEAAYAVGRELAKLAWVRLDDPAILAIDPGFESASESGATKNARLIEHLLESPTLATRLTAAERSRVRQFSRSHDGRLAASDDVGSIAHGDFNAANILVGEARGAWRVAAILDWEFAVAASPFHDIGNFLRYERASRPRVEPWFSRGLSEGGVALATDWRTTARLADLGALCELLSRADAPEVVAREVRDLVLATIDERELP
jgi:aminoglycoside phosphotransferase (APT) family kinase protein